MLMTIRSAAGIMFVLVICAAGIMFMSMISATGIFFLFVSYRLATLLGIRIIATHGKHSFLL